VSRPEPGLAFYLICDLGFAIGLVTHDTPKIGSLIWIAEPTFESEPMLEQVRQIDRWRWPIFFPVGAAVRRKVVTPLGVISVPRALKQFPVMRSGNKGAGWMAFTEMDGHRQSLDAAADPSIPIYKVVNDTRLKEMIVSGWKPQQEW
jgi:hypothetical protein